MRLCTLIIAIFLLSTNLSTISLVAQTSQKGVALPELLQNNLSDDHNHNHSHDHHHDHDHGNDLSFVKNNGQWENPVRYRASLGGLNTVFLEKGGFTYLFHNDKDAEKLFDHGKRDRESIQPVRSHAYHVAFLNANLATLKGSEPRTEYYNYFLGDDRSKWASHVPVFDQVRYENLYPGIHLDAYDVDGYFKYDFVVEPGATPNSIGLRYEGADRLQIKKGDLVIHTSVDKIIEHEPYAYQEIDGKRITVKCNYVLNEGTVTFHFPEGYNERYKLIIDPTVVAATLSGTTNNENFGHSATYDFSGNIYVGAQSFGSGYPTNLGAFQQNFGGGLADIAVSKYNTNGTQLVYASYIGGSGQDLPHSLITDFDGQLYIYGSSDSNNYPTTTNAVQTSKGGRIDIVISVLTADGSSLVGSTYVGGSLDDGFNHCETNASYGDDYRGEIMLDRERNVYIASQSSSTNFPTTPGALDRNFNSIGTNSSTPSPAQDGVVFKLNNDLSNFYWSTYLGGNGADTAMGLRVDENNNTVYVTGTAAGANFPMPNGGFQSNYQGGDSDGYIVQLSEDGTTILNGTFWGTNRNDNSYFMDVDLEGDVHIYGISTGVIPITPGVFSAMAGSRQFISSFTPDLSSLVYSTVIGRGPNSETTSGPFTEFDFVPVAFMVDKCDNIYFSGYDATANLPLTNDFISNQGGTFYLGVLEPDASALSFATYYGAANHVDGGTSRFDKSGVVYQGVCSCTDFVMETNNNAWATNQAERCDIGVFKIDFDVPTVTAFAAVEPASSGCAPFAVNFEYTGKNGTVFEWDFGNGMTSTSENPNTVFQEAGNYEVRFVASNTGACNEQDTFYMQINVLDNTSSVTDTTVCGANDGVFVNATTTNANYLWNDGVIDATRTINQEGVFWVDISISGCTSRDSFIVRFEPELEYSLGQDFSYCDVISAPLDATRSDLVSYRWDDGSTNPIRQISGAGVYDIYVENAAGCNARDTVNINFGTTPPTELGLPDTLCQGDSRNILAPNLSGLPVTYSWNTGENTSQINVDQTGEYIVILDNNGCKFSDTLNLHYTEFDLAFEQTNVSCFELCDGEGTAVFSGEAPPFNLTWDNGDSDDNRAQLCEGNYTLTITDQRGCVYENTLVITEPESLEITTEIVDVTCAGDQNGSIRISEILGGTEPFQVSFDNNDFQRNTILNNLNGGFYDVLVRDENGCEQGKTVNVYEPPFITVDAGPDQRIKLGEGTELEGQIFPLTNQVYNWLPADSLECNSCLDSAVDPTRTTPYILSVTDTVSGCVLEDQVVISVDKDRNIYIPNAFSPDNNGINDIFQVYAGVGVREILVLRIYDRWGEQVYEANNISPFDNKTGWDGFFREEAMNPAVFVYYAEVLFVDNERKEYAGDVTLLK